MFRLNSTIHPRVVSETRNGVERLASTGTVLRVPHMRQSLGYSCAPSCVAMVVGAVTGTMPSDRVLVKRYGITTRGSTTADIERMVRGELKAGLRGIGRATHQVVRGLLEQGRPLLAGVATGGGGHAILIVGLVELSNGGMRLVVNDPGLSMQLFVTPQTVEAALSQSHAIEL